MRIRCRIGLFIGRREWILPNFYPKSPIRLLRTRFTGLNRKRDPILRLNLPLAGFDATRYRKSSR